MKKIHEEKLNKDIQELSKMLSPIDELIPPAKNISPSQITQKLSGASRFKSKRPNFYMRAASLAAACLVLVMGLFLYSNKPLYIPQLTGTEIVSTLTDTEILSTISDSISTSSNLKLPDFGLESASKSPESADEKTGEIQDYKDIIEALKTIDSRNKNYWLNAQRYFGSGAEILAPEGERTLPGTSDESEHGKTNTQVEGVDEADIIKNDGKYIYWLSFDEIKIISALPADNMKVISTISLKGVKDNIYTNSYEMFVYQDTLVVIGSSYGSIKQYFNESLSKRAPSIYYSNEQAVAVTIFDIKDRANPKNVRTFKQDGYYVSSRLIGKHLYLVTTVNADMNLIEEGKPELLVPNISDTNTTGKFTPLAAKDILIAPNSSTPSYAVVSGLDITDTQKEANTKSYLGFGNYIYASTSNIYIAYIEYTFENNKFMSSTNIIKFGISDGNVSVKTSGSVPGSIIGQFAMDEFDNHFRIATTTTTGSIESMVNNIYVLDENLKLTGKVEGLAPGETIYAARFMGEKAYLVTYMTTDPLFVIDLKDHANPKVLSQLEMPGFSNYLHPYSENLLIGFGKDSEEIVSGGFKFAITRGLKISLYDVSDPLNPTEVTKLILGQQGSYSEVNSNHKALLFSKEKNIIGFPVTLYEKKYQDPFEGYYVLGLDPNKGFEIREKIEVPNIHHGHTMRGTYIGNTLYILSNDKIMALSLDSFEQIGSLDLPVPKKN